MRQAINAVVIKDKRILLVRKRETWILPGGKPEERETDVDCLNREFSQELPELILIIGSFYGFFKGKTPHTEDILESKIYFADVEGDKKPSAEISESAWVSRKEMRAYNLSDITYKIIDSLKKDRYL